MRPRIYADFNGLMQSPRDAARSMVPLDTWGSLRDLSNAGIKLREGTELVIHDASDDEEDLEAEAVAYYDPERKWWYAELVTSWIRRFKTHPPSYSVLITVSGSYSASRSCWKPPLQGRCAFAS